MLTWTGKVKIMAELKDLSRIIAKKINKIERRADLAVRRAARLVVRSVASGTPADEGTAISNWQVSVGEPKQGVIAAHIPGSKASTKDANIRATQEKGFAVIKTQDALRQIAIVNNLDYIDDLNRGTSIQAPAMFVQIAVRQGLRGLKGIKLVD